MNKPVNKNIKDLEVKSQDETAFYCCYRKPEGSGPFPAVIFIHGGLGNNQEYTRSMLDWSVAELLFEERFVVFSADYRVDLEGRDIGDVVAAFKFVAGLEFVDEKRIAYFGDSHGAYLAIMAAAQSAPFALIHGWGVADMAKWYNHIIKMPVSYYEIVSKDLAKSLGGTPEQAPEAYHQVSPIAHVADIKCPVLLLHGDKDEEVPVAHANLLAQAIERAGGEYDLNIFENAGHGLRSPEVRNAMDPLVLEFLNRHLQKQH
jgi:dipeptidyl aminopeptidase/acylaminoacyl peptidase